MVGWAELAKANEQKLRWLLLIKWTIPVIASAMYREKVRPGTGRENGLGHAGSGEWSNPPRWNQLAGDCFVTAFLSM